MRRKVSGISIRIGIIYLIIGAIWIFFSDKLLLLLFDNPNTITNFQTYKGWFFVLSSALIITLLIYNQTQRKTIVENAFRKISDEIAGKYNDDFFKSLVKSIGNTTCADVVFIGNISENDSQKIETIAVYNNGEFLENFSYELNQNHYEKRNEARMCFYHQKAQSIFPENSLLQKMEIDNYIGIYLYNKHNIPNGILVALNKKPLKHQKLTESIFQQFSIHAQHEIERSKNESYLLKSQEQFMLLANNSSDSIILQNNEGQFEFISPAIENLTGFTPKEYMQFGPSERIHPDDKPKLRNLISEIIDGKKITNLTYQIRTKDEKWKWIETRISAIKNEKGKILKLISSSNDISERIKNNKLLIDTKQFYERIIEGVQDGIWVTDKNDTIFYVNSTLEKIAGVSKEVIIGNYHISVLPKETTEEFNTYYVKAKKTLRNLWFKATVITKDKKLSYLNGWLIPQLKNNQYNGMICTIRDVTERSIAEIRLNESRDRYRKVSALASDFAYSMTVDNNSNFEYEWTFGSYEKITGYTYDELNNIGGIAFLTHPEDLGIINKHNKIILRGNSDQTEFRIITKQGTIKWLQTSSQPEWNTENNRVVRIIGSATDITERIKAKQEIEEYQKKLKRLNLELFNSEEKEKRALAITLHDHFSQLLALAKMKMSELLISHPQLHEDLHLNDAIKYINEALAETRAMTYELSPPILYELGLIHAIEWYVETIRKKHGLKFNFFKKTQEINFNIEIQVIIYRIMTELITNILKHAEAKSVLLIIEEVNNLFYLRISDDGKGFNMNDKSLTSKSFGLFSIRERIEQIQGDLQLVSAIGRGTVVDISIPLK